MRVTVFTYESWLSGLILAVVVLAAITPLVVRGEGWTIFLSYFFSFFMILNGLGHIAVSFYLRRPMPGVYSSPPYWPPRHSYSTQLADVHRENLGGRSICVPPSTQISSSPRWKEGRL